MSRRALILGTLLAAVGLGACYSLDPFLYSRERVDHYTLPAEGDTPEETVSPDRIEPVDLVVDAHVRLGAAYVKSAQQPPLGYVLYFHGICCNLDAHIARPKGLSNLGYDVLVFDYRGWGTSTDVEPTEQGLLEDSRAALAWLSARSGLPADRLVYYGRSFGTAVATQLAADKPPAALVLESPFSSVQGLVGDSSNMDLPASFLSEGAWDTEGRLRAMRGVPLLLLHGAEDDFVRPEFSERLYSVAHEPKRLVLVEGADHDDVPLRMGVDYAPTLADFLSGTRAWP
ncbi:alpha/beta hydrolase [Archangium lipolyticum]|uniref:alpha/beta hydrolase n=1 Tax=Archangium lipolyticum TaxID=2970465 RepID=UPI002149BCB0|nr:alpha/beta hydrolase [Archangium lipolyticum]